MSSNFIRGLIKKSVLFGTIIASADATVQLIQTNRHLQSKFNWKSLERHGLVGSCVIGPVLYCYYFALDKRLPGTSLRTVATKVAFDVVIANIAYYCLFYYGISFLEHKDHERAKKDTKDVLGKTYAIGLLYWMPVMAMNFKYLSPQSRIIFVAIASYIEMNALCLRSRGENPRPLASQVPPAL